jgi:hypothetical protein
VEVAGGNLYTAGYVEVWRLQEAMYTQLDMSRLYKAGYVEAAGGHYTYVDMRRLQEDIYI